MMTKKEQHDLQGRAPRCKLVYDPTQRLFDISTVNPIVDQTWVPHIPWRIHGAAIYGVPWIPSMYTPMLAYSTMDPSWDVAS